jgi:hypothetical protein
MTRQLFQYDPTIGYRFVPGLKARVLHECGGYLLRTNEAGFRCGHRFEPRKAEGARRVLLFGDSYTAGDGVSDKHRYAEVLERLLPGLEVYNFGLSGSGTDQQYLIWREVGRRFEHDVVVIAVLVENIRRVAARYRPYSTREGKRLVLAKPYFELADGALELRHVPVPRDPLPEGTLEGEEFEHVDRGGRYPRLRAAVNRLAPGLKDRLQSLVRFQPVPAFDRGDHPHWLLMKAILERWAAEIEKPALICPIPLYQHVEETASARGYQARFAELALPPHVRVHDPLPDFHAAPLEERRGYRFTVDCHLTPPAHEVLARSLARAVAPLLEPGAARA